MHPRMKQPGLPRPDLGETFIDPAVAGKPFARTAQGMPSQDTAITAELSEREIDVLKLLARGHTNADISERLFLTEGTVRNYVSGILAKLDVVDRTQDAILALRHGIVDDEDTS
jgi:DNA-binding NarL/FixJ family response regulator